MRTQYERWIDPATGELHEAVEVYEAGGPKPPTLGRAYLVIAVLEGALTVEEALEAVSWTQYERWIDVATGEEHESATVYVGEAPLPPTLGRAYLAIAVLNGIHTVETARELVHWTQYERWIDVASGETHESATVYVGDAPLPPTLGRAYQLIAVIQGIHSLAAARAHAETSTARQVTRVELWDAERAEALPIPGLEPAEYDLWPYVASDQFREQLGNPTVLTLTLEVGCAPVVADPVYLARRRVLRVIYDDGSVEEYRISRFERELSGETDPQVTAESLWTMLDTRIARRVLEGSGMVDVSFTILRRPAQQLLELILADAPTPFVAGSAGEYAAREGSIRAHAASHLALLRQLCQDLGCEWEEEWDEAAGAYRINLVREVGGKGVRPIEQGSGTLGNRRSLRRDQDGTDLFTRVVPLAGPDDEVITIAQATWPVIGAAYSGSQNRTTLQLGGDPIWVDGMPFGAGEAGEFGAGASWHSVISTSTPGTVVVAGDARALTSGRFRLAGGVDLTYLADPAAEAETSIVERPLVRSDIPPAANLLQEAGVTADMTEWAGGMPVGVEKIGAPTVTQTTDPRSARVGGVAAEIHAHAGEGIRTIPIPITPTTRSPYFSATAALRVMAGGVRLEVIGADGKSYPLGDAATSSEDLLRALVIGGIRPPAGGTRLMITALKAGTVFTLDAWTLTQSATPYEYAPEMGPQALWHAGGRMLARDGGLTPDALDGAVFDVAHFDGETADEILIGSRVQVVDSGLDLESRVVAMNRSYKGGPDYRKTVTISRRRQDLVDYLKDDEAPDRRLGEGGETRPAPAVAIQGVRVDEAGRVVVSAGGGEVVSRILITAAVGGAPPVPTPQAHHGEIAGAVGTVQTTISAEPGDVVRVMARGESADGVLGIVAEAEYQVPKDPPEDPGDLGREIVLTPRWRQGPGSARLETTVHYGSGSRSLRIQYQYASIPGGAHDRNVDYTTDLAAGRTTTKHLILDEVGAVRFWPVEPTAPQITVTPYTGPGGTGEAGTAATLPIEPLAESGDVGVRISVQGSSTVYQSDRLMVKPPASLGLQIVPDPVTGRPLLQIAGAAGPEQGGIGQIGPMIKGAMLYAGGVGSDRFLVVQPGGVGQYLKMGAGDTPEWGSVVWADGFDAYDFRYSQHGHKHSALDITSDVLPLTRGGLGNATFQHGQVLFADTGAGYIRGVGSGAAGQVLTMGATFPAWQDLPGSGIPTPTEAGRFPIATGDPATWTLSAYRLPTGPGPEGMVLRATSTPGGTTWGWVPWSSLDSDTIPVASTSQRGIVQLGTASGQAAAGNHTHSLASLGAAAAAHKHSALDINDGVLSLTRGGLGNATFQHGQVLFADTGTGYIRGVATGVQGQVLTIGPGNTPGWQNLPSTDIPLPTEAGQFLIAAGTAPNISWVRSAYRLPSGPPAEGMLMRGTSTPGGTTWGWVPWSSLDSTTIPVYAQRWPTPAEVGAYPAGGGTMTGNLDIDTGTDSSVLTLGGPGNQLQLFTYAGMYNFLQSGKSLTVSGQGVTSLPELRVIAGTVTVDGTLVATGLKKTSARWLKRDIEDAPDALTLLAALRPRQFRWKESGEWDMGFIADEVPALIGTPERDAVDFDRITAALVGGWQVHDARLAALERRLGALEGG